MQEIFENVSNEVKEIADVAWRLALSQEDGVTAAKFLDRITNYYDRFLNEEEMDFLRFYFNMKMELMKE